MRKGRRQTLTQTDVLNQCLKKLAGTIEEAGAMIIAGALPVVAIHEVRLAQLFSKT